MPRATTVLLSTAAVVSLLTACETDGGGDPIRAPATSETTASLEPTSDASTTDTPTDDPTDAGPGLPENTAAQTAKNSGVWDLVLTGVRVAEHKSFDRIVLEFTGTGVPGWTANYVDRAVLDGSGEAVTLGGGAILDIYASGTTSPGPGGLLQRSQAARARERRRRKRRVRRRHLRGLHASARRDRWRSRPVPGLRAHRSLAPGG